MKDTVHTRVARSILIALIALVASWIATPTANAQAPQGLVHEGRLLQADAPLEGDLNVRFDFYDDGGALLHSEERIVTFLDGYYTVRFGEDGTLPDPLLSGAVTEMGMALLDADPGGPVELLPRHRLNAVPYALIARGVSGGVVSAERVEIFNGQSATVVIDSQGRWVGAPFDASALAENSVESVHVLDGTLTGDDIADGGITGDDIADGSVQESDFGDEVVSSRAIQSSAVTADKIAAGAVGEQQLQLNAIYSYHINDGQVSSADLEDDSVQSQDIRDGTLTRDDVQPGGGLFAHKGDIYEVTETLSVPVGVVAVGEASCADSNDLPLQGSCYALPSSDASQHSGRALGWSDEAVAARYECGFLNDGGSLASAEVRILCITVP